MLPVFETPAAPTVAGSIAPRAMAVIVAEVNLQTPGTLAVTSTLVVPPALAKPADAIRATAATAFRKWWLAFMETPKN